MVDVNAVEIVWGEFFRMFAYAVVIVCAFFEYKQKKHSVLLVIGDILFSILAVISIVYARYFNEPNLARLLFITPAAIIWAIFHVINLLKTPKI